MGQEGGCACGAVRYRLTAAPLIVHACHCCDCQKMTGSAFVLNMWIEKNRVEADHSAPKSFILPAGSGKPHKVFYCGNCMTRLWSKYHAAPGDTLLVRVGTLDHPERVEPDVHIFTRRNCRGSNRRRTNPRSSRFTRSRRSGLPPVRSGCAAT
jgi:hypothetical protein